jgi:hypothetical protein
LKERPEQNENEAEVDRVKPETLGATRDAPREYRPDHENSGLKKGQCPSRFYPAHQDGIERQE